MASSDTLNETAVDVRLALGTESTDERRELVARMGVDLPAQGEWTAHEYLDHAGRGVEYDNGCLEFTPVPTESHNNLIKQFFVALVNVLGFDNVQISGYRLELWGGKFREPDVLCTIDHSDWTDRQASRADLVVEVVSESSADRHRDLVEKRSEYEKAGIPEYWIVDPRERQIVVLTLVDDAYREHGVFALGEIATSVVLPEFQVDVTDTFRTAGVVK